MGHTEMLLAVAGQSQEQITERTKRLASGDWSAFTPPEQAAFALAKKQAKTPWLIGQEDISTLIDQFGAARAADVIWWSCRCHFMTRVADAFQLPLEKENVFQSPKPAQPPKSAQPGGQPSPQPPAKQP